MKSCWKPFRRLKLWLISLVRLLEGRLASQAGYAGANPAQGTDLVWSVLHNANL
jgi:hypothetical protein